MQLPTTRWVQQTQERELIASRVRHTGFVWGAELADNDEVAVILGNGGNGSMSAAGARLRYAALHGARLDRTSLGASLLGVFLGFAGTEFAQLLAWSPAGNSVYQRRVRQHRLRQGEWPIRLDCTVRVLLTTQHAHRRLWRGTRLVRCSSQNVVGLVTAVTLVLTSSVGISFAVAGMTSARGGYRNDGRRWLRTR